MSRSSGGWFARVDDHVQQIVVVPVVDGDPTGAGDRGGHTGSGGGIAEEEPPAIAHDGQALTVLVHGDQVQVPGEIDVDERAIDGADLGHARERGGIERLRVGGHPEQVRALVAQYQDVFIPIVLEIGHQAAMIVRPGNLRQQLRVRLKRSVRIDQQTESCIALGDEQAVPAIAMVIDGFQRALVTVGVIEHLRGGIRQLHRNARNGGLLEDERSLGHGVFASFELGFVHGTGAFGRQLPVPLERRAAFVLSSEPDQRLAQNIMRGGMVRHKADQFLEQSDGRLKLPKLLMRPAELKRHRAHLRIQVARSLQRLHRRLELAQTQQTATQNVMGRGRVVVEVDRLTGLGHGVGGVTRQQESVREVQSGVAVDRVDRHRCRKRGDGALRLPFVVVVLAHVHEPGELILRWRGRAGTATGEYQPQHRQAAPERYGQAGEPPSR